MNAHVPRSHPRYHSLKTRDLVVAGVEAGLTSLHGLIAQGRGEAFDYLLGEKTHRFANRAIDAAAAMLLCAQHPVISVNGNVAALAREEIILLARLLDAPLEVNIFHSSKKRERAIRQALIRSGASRVLLPARHTMLPGIDHNRRFIHPQGVARADVVFVPLEDGDRCQALRIAGKDVITVDLNPLSRTSRHATVTIVDNLIRCLPALCKQLITLQRQGSASWAKIAARYRNDRTLREAERCLRRSSCGGGFQPPARKMIGG
jgi:4-phosphopantoate--beta-alanine ligase